nr:T9SS type A sorting domain-containing protein [Bacteroidota bacterium]
MKKYLIYLFTLLAFVSKAQQGFQLSISTEEDEVFWNVSEDYYKNYIFAGYLRHPEPQIPEYSAYVAKISQQGDTIIKTIFRTDTVNLILYQSIPLENGNYLFIGKNGDTITGDFQYFFTLLTDHSFNILKTDQVLIPEIYRDIHFKQFNLKDDNGQFIIGGKLLYDMIHGDLFLCRIDSGGEILNFENFIFTGHNPDSFGIFKSDNPETYKIFGAGFYAYAPIEILEIDIGFNIQAHHILSSFVDIDHFRTIKQFNDSAYLLGGKKTTMEPYDSNLEVMIFDTNQNIYGEINLGRDTVWEYPAWERCLDFIDKNNIYVSGFRGGAWWYNYQDYVQIWLLDEELNLKASKFFGGDANYHVYSISATSDGGCIVAATRHDETQGDERDIFILKIFEDDLLTSAEETPYTHDYDAIIYPNPGSEYLTIETCKRDFQFSLFNESGSLIIQKNNITTTQTNIKTQHLPKGVYYYSLTKDNQIIQTGKWIKSP